MKENILNGGDESILSENLTQDEKIQELKRRNAKEKKEAERIEFLSEYTNDLKEGDAFDLGHLEEEEEYKSPFAEEEELPKTYDNYVMLHTGKNIDDKSLEEKQKYLGNCLAAMSISQHKKSFDLKEIHRQGDQNQQIYVLSELTEEQVDAALKDKKSLEKFRASKIKELYSVEPGKEEEYIKHMKILHENMMSKTGRSKEYKAFYDKVAKIASMNPADEKFRAKLDIANKELVTAIDNYHSDKKTVRWGTDGNKRFKNCLDAMAIVRQYVPNAEPLMNTYETLINIARNATLTNKNADDYIDLRKYGSGRAALNPDKKNQLELKQEEEKKKEKEKDKKKEKEEKIKEKAKKSYKSEKEIEREMDGFGGPMLPGM